MHIVHKIIENRGIKYLFHDMALKFGWDDLSGFFFPPKKLHSIIKLRFKNRRYI